MTTRSIVQSVTLFLALAGSVLNVNLALASDSEVRYLDARVNLADKPSLQHGAKLFVNYCLSCHAAAFMRYNRMARDIGISEEQLKQNMLFAAEKVGSRMTVAMTAEDAKSWFGVAVPDLSVISRARGPDWLFTYLMTFYKDESRPTGVNNLVFKDVAMPHVLGELQGTQVLRAHSETGSAAEPPEPHHALLPPDLGRPHELLELKSQGSMSSAEFAGAMRDLTSFLAYLGEPAKLVRYKIGIWVLLFLAVFYLLARSLYKEYWKDVH